MGTRCPSLSKCIDHVFPFSSSNWKKKLHPWTFFLLEHNWLSIRPLLSFSGRISEVDFYLHLANRDLCLSFTPRRAASETFSRSERDTSDVTDTERRRKSPLWCLALWLWALWCGRTEQRGHPPCPRRLSLAASAFIWEWCLPSEGMWEKALLAIVTFMSWKAVF